MLVIPIRRFEIRRLLAILLLAGGLVSCAYQEPKPTALVGDPNAKGESSIPWNKPQGWESAAGLPLGLSGADGSANPNNPAGY